MEPSHATGACSVAASYKPPMLVTRVQLPACALFEWSSKSSFLHAKCVFRQTAQNCWGEFQNNKEFKNKGAHFI